MKTCSHISKIRTGKLISILILSAFLDVGTASSDGLGGLGGTVGGVVGGTGDTVASVVTGAPGIVTNPIVGQSGIGVTAKSSLLNGIDAKLQVLSPSDLLKLCLSVGGGNQKCGSGNRQQKLSLIQVKLKTLGPRTLANLCVSVGGECGGANGGGSGGNGGGGDNNGGGNHPPILSASSNVIVGDELFCTKILRNPQYYGKQSVKLCRPGTRRTD